MLAEFLCLKCNFKWKSNPGPIQCPKCNHLYVKWLNYKEMGEQWDLEERRNNG